MVNREKTPCVTSLGKVLAQYMVSCNQLMGPGMELENWLVVGATGGHWQPWQAQFPHPQYLTHSLAHQKPAFREWGMWIQGSVWNTSFSSYLASRTFLALFGSSFFHTFFWTQVA